MASQFDDRCDILKKYLDIRESVLRIRNVYEGMSSEHTAYKAFQKMIEEKRHELDVLQRENPWLGAAFEVMHNHP
jgi:hypothetical protein